MVPLRSAEDRQPGVCVRAEPTRWLQACRRRAWERHSPAGAANQPGAAAAPLPCVCRLVRRLDPETRLKMSPHSHDVARADALPSAAAEAAGLPASAAAQQPRCAWVTYADNPIHFDGALIMYASMAEAGTRHPFIIMVPEGSPLEIPAALAGGGGPGISLHPVGRLDRGGDQYLYARCARGREKTVEGSRRAARRRRGSGLLRSGCPTRDAAALRQGLVCRHVQTLVAATPTPAGTMPPSTSCGSGS
jgi:hypothetical protein